MGMRMGKSNEKTREWEWAMRNAPSCWSSVGCFSKIRCHRNQLKGTSLVLVTASSSNGSRIASRNITSTS